VYSFPLFVYSFRSLGNSSVIILTIDLSRWN